MLTLRLNSALLALTMLIFAVSAIVNITTYGGLTTLPYIQWFSGATGLLISGVLLVLMLLSSVQVLSFGKQLPKVRGLRWIMLLTILVAVYSIYNALFAMIQRTQTDPLFGHVYSLRSLSSMDCALALLAVSYLYRLIAWQHSNPNDTPTSQTEINTP